MTGVAGPGRAILRGPALLQINHVGRVRYRAARGTVARVYRAVEHDFGVLAPPVALHAPAPEVIAAVWMMLREAMLVPGRCARAEKEAVAAAVSADNACPFCVTIHGATLNALVPGDREPRLRALQAWARTGSHLPAAAASESVFGDEEERAELVGVAVTLHYLNRMVNVFLGEAPMPPQAPDPMLGPITRVLVGLIRTGAKRVSAPGTSLDLLPAAPGVARPELDWAQGSPEIADAFARATAAIEEAGGRSVPESARAMVLAQLEAWDGRPLPLQADWIDRALQPLPEAERGAGRLVLLTALASYRVDESVVAGFRAYRADDESLIAAAAWASLAAARTAGARLSAAARTA